MTEFNIEHKNPQMKNRIARAPYNFVSLPYGVVKLDQKMPPHDRYDGSLCSGYIDFSIKTESPVYVGCGIKPESFRQSSEDKVGKTQADDADKFFFIQDEDIPVIPASSIRGMVRNLVEIASFGKVAWVTNDKIGYRAVGDKTNFGNYYREQVKDQKAGYMRKQGNSWYIQPAKKIEKNNEFIIVDVSLVDKMADSLEWKFGGKKEYYTTDNDKKYFGVCDVYFDSGSLFRKNGRGSFRVSKISFKEANGYTKGMLIHSGYISGKHHDTIIGAPDSTANYIKIPDDVIKDYKAQLTDWQIQLLGENGVLKEGYPVFYKYDDKENMIVMFGHTPMFRMVYKNTPFEHIPPDVSDDSILDMSDAIFGYASGKSKGGYDGYASRVYFSDAVLQNGQENVWLSDAFFPKILSGPKPSAFQHYLTQRDPDNIKSLEHYDNDKDGMAAIRGYKLYWHKGNVELADIKEDDNVAEKKPDQYTRRIRPVRSGVEFKSRIYFENLREEELGALLWVLNLPEKCRHTIGMGKPYGMGAVKITPTLYIEDKIKRYQKLFDNDKWMSGIKKEDMQRYIDAFEGFIMERIDSRDKRDAESFSGLKRIRMLLKMLEWPGPDKNDTSYMDMKEFKERKVLPTPIKEQYVDKTLPNEAKNFNNSRNGQANNAKNNNKPKYDNNAKHTDNYNTSIAEAFKKAGFSGDKDVKNNKKHK